jgi:hypothetical protein
MLTDTPQFGRRTQLHAHTLDLMLAWPPFLLDFVSAIQEDSWRSDLPTGLTAIEMRLDPSFCHRVGAYVKLNRW